MEEAIQRVQGGKAGEEATANELKKHLQAIREKEFRWTFDVTKCVIEGAFDDVADAFSRFLRDRTNTPLQEEEQSRESFTSPMINFRLGTTGLLSLS